MDLGILGKRALVTGSSSGIGEAIAKTLAAEGATVVVHGRREVEAQRVVANILAAGGKATYALGELATDSGADAVAMAAGDIDILVNNAGVYVAKGWFEETADEWTQWYNVNVGSMVRLNNRLVPAMKAKGWGRVIAIASGVGTKPLTDMPGYSATKVACINLAVSLAHSLAGTGITSNAVSPGIILTGGLDAMFDQMGAVKDTAERAKIAAGFAPGPVGRAGTPQEIADAVVFLCSDRANFITGQNLRVDGGYVPTVN
jgi:NAD(P)-dependent dehydrogenase (short-subunit alcohol dehydrogenase family)